MTKSFAPALLGIGTAVPAYAAAQSDVYAWMAHAFQQQPAVQRWMRSLFAYSGIGRRHSVLPDYQQPPGHSRFAPGRTPEESATTAERMAVYTQESVPLGAQAAERALADAAAASGCTAPEMRGSITHLVTISCTGFFAPGPDLLLAARLGLPPTLRRTLIGFMGCSAMFNGLRAAWEIVRGDPSARVLVVSIEICSLHAQPGAEREDLIAAALFADGASACVVGLPPAIPQRGIFQLQDFHTEIKPETQQEMVWQIGNHGFALRLSPDIPQHLAASAPQILQNIFPAERPSFWAIHPGGPAIVDQLMESFQLQPQQVEATRSVLREYGNMSSATIIFVLERLRQEFGPTHPASGTAMAFGPGLVVEMARLRWEPQPEPVLPEEPVALLEMVEA